MKNELESKSIKNLLKQNAKTRGWALCIGAGTSRGIFPDWKQLIEYLMKEIDDEQYSKENFDTLTNRFSLEALLQAGYELKGVSEKEFTALLSDLLYSEIKNKLSEDDFNVFIKVMDSISIDKVKKDIWKKFFCIRDKELSNISANSIAKVISNIIDTDLKPSEIITFNGEPMLLGLINSYVYEKHIKEYPKGNEPVKKYIDVINRSVSVCSKGRIPYIFNHGTLPVPSGKNLILPAIDKLVFTENEYFNLSNNSYSWQSATFLRICSAKPMVFVGVSLTDQNMRRWLSWTQSVRAKEIEFVDKLKKNSTQHFWIEKDPKDTKIRAWMEACVYHLGIRIIWIEDWDQIEMVFKEMLGIS
jgi:hypothetical protein